MSGKLVDKSYYTNNVIDSQITDNEFNNKKSIILEPIDEDSEGESRMPTQLNKPAINQGQEYKSFVST